MFIDDTGVMLVGLAAGLVILAHYLYKNPGPDERTPWAAGFLAAGLLGLATAVPMVLTWPLPGSYNIAFGEPTLFLSVAFLGAAATLALRWEPLIPALYGFFGGPLAILIGLRIMDLGLTKSPTVAGVAYIATGLGALLTLPAIQFRQVRLFALAAATCLGVAALLFLTTGYEAYWQHLAAFAHWLPPTMRTAR
jgi:putative membrane protein